MENFGNDKVTKLASGLLAGATSVVVTDSANWPAVNFRIRIDNELMLVTNKGAGEQVNWTIVRGIEGTFAEEHIAGADVYHVLTAGSLAQYVAERAAPKAVTVSVSASRSLNKDDDQKTLIVNSASAVSLTITDDATGLWADGAFVAVYMAGAGVPTFAAAAGVTLTNPGSLVASTTSRWISVARVGINTWTVL